MTEQSQWGEGMPYATHDAYLTRPISRTEWALSGKGEKQERLEAKSRMAAVLRRMPRDKDVLPRQGSRSMPPAPALAKPSGLEPPVPPRRREHLQLQQEAASRLSGLG